jgi:hypothetical protein
VVIESGGGPRLVLETSYLLMDGEVTRLHCLIYPLPATLIIMLLHFSN